MLHITNGDSAGGTLRQAGVGGDVVCWRDVLHEGPVPAGHTLEEMSDGRAHYIAARGWGEFEHVRAEFAARDQALITARRHDEIVLWFEHDLYDQLQLIQILDAFRACPPGDARLTLICSGSFPGKASFHGLGELNAAELASLFPSREPVTEEQLALASDAWRAFTAPDPRELAGFAAADRPALPFLVPALRRFLQEYPSVRNGLSLTEQRILDMLSAAPLKSLDLFKRNMDVEQVFLPGDTSFFGYLHGMRNARTPLIDGEEKSALKLTGAGRAVREGKQDAIALNGIDRWMGGVHLCRQETDWRWDQSAGKLVASASRPKP